MAFFVEQNQCNDGWLECQKVTSLTPDQDNPKNKNTVIVLLV